MADTVNLIVLCGDSVWPHLQILAHLRRQPAGLQRLFLVASDDRPLRARVANTIAALARREFPDLRAEVRVGAGRLEELRQRLEAWQESGAEETWFLDLTAASQEWTVAAGSWLDLPGKTAVLRDAAGVWRRIARNGNGQLEASPIEDARRDTTDSLSVSHLVQAQLAGSDWRFAAQPVAPLPALPVMDASLRSRWDWRAAFKAAGEDPREDSDAELLARFIGALVAGLGVANARHGTLTPTQENSAPGISALWLNHGGRLLVIQPILPTREQDAPAIELTPLLQRVASVRRLLEPLNPEWLVLAPTARATEIEKAFAAAERLLLMDEAGAPDLLARLPEWLDVPASGDCVEADRRLRLSLAETGHVRAFAPEAAVLHRVASTAPEPGAVDADALIEEIRNARGQNWILWSHDKTLHLRLPNERRPRPEDDWRLMVAGISGAAPDQIKVAAKAASHFTLSLPGSPEARKAILEWLRPFLNGAVTFAAAQQRFAAKARVAEEAAHIAGPAEPARAPSPARPQQPPRGPERRAPERRRPAPPRSSRDALADLDEALDAALGKTPTPRQGA